MNKYVIRGGRPLFGEVTISGAKNAAVGIIPAALLVDGVCRIENIPQNSVTSLIWGIFSIRHTPSTSSEAGRMATAAFFAPLISMVP